MRFGSFAAALFVISSRGSPPSVAQKEGSRHSRTRTFAAGICCRIPCSGGGHGTTVLPNRSDKTTVKLARLLSSPLLVSLEQIIIIFASCIAVESLTLSSHAEAHCLGTLL